MIAAGQDTPVPAWQQDHSLVQPRPPADAVLGHAHHEATSRLSVEWPAPGVVVVRIGGEIDLASLPRVTEMIRQRLRAASLQTVVLDFSTVTFASSAAMELLITAQRRCRQRDCTLLVVPGNGPVAKLLEITGLSTMVSLREDVTAAVAEARG
ncbi:hypothetical protein GCM10009854_32900 [Saccharopolyspora halophila]|uniref:Anti-sigma factor antagonist n=1 Tax=Saccharopolyspora halophila TaxID=405551 RepID=A0ABN3GIG6_9PSEU